MRTDFLDSQFAALTVKISLKRRFAHRSIT